MLNVFVESLATTVVFEVQLQQQPGDLFLYPTDAFRSLSADCGDEEKWLVLKLNPLQVERNIPHMVFSFLLFD